MTRPFPASPRLLGAIALLLSVVLGGCGADSPDGDSGGGGGWNPFSNRNADTETTSPETTSPESTSQPNTTTTTTITSEGEPTITPDPQVTASPGLTDTPNLDDRVPNLGEDTATNGQGRSVTGEPAPLDTNTVEPESSTIPSLAQRVNGLGGTAQIDIPADWIIDQGLHTSAEIRVSNPNEWLYLIVLAEPKSGQRLPDLYQQSFRYQDLFMQKLSTIERRTTEVTQVGGYGAIQVTIRGRFQGTEVTYLHTTVDTPRAYYQILAWTDSRQFDRYQLELQLITDSFRPYSTN